MENRRFVRACNNKTIIKKPIVPNEVLKKQESGSGELTFCYYKQPSISEIKRVEFSHELAIQMYPPEYPT